MRPAGKLPTLVDRLYGYDFFISYGHLDWMSLEPGHRHIPRALASQLEGRYRIFFDESSYLAGDLLDEATCRRVAMSRQLVLVVGPNAVGSTWVHEEVQVALNAGHVPIVIDPFGTFAELSVDHPLRSLLGERIDVRRQGRSDDELITAAASRLAASADGRRVERRRLRVFRWATGVATVIAVVATVQSWRATVSATRVADRVRWEQALQAGGNGNYGAATQLLREAQTDDSLNGWRSLALTTLIHRTPRWVSDESFVAADRDRRRLALWSERTGLRVQSLDHSVLPQTLAAPSSAQGVGAWLLPREAAAFSRDGRFLLVPFDSGGTAIWDVDAGGPPIREWKGYQTSLSRDRSRLLAVQGPPSRAESGQVELWSVVGSLRRLHSEKVGVSTRAPIRWTLDGHALVALKAGGLRRIAPGGSTVLLDRGEWFWDVAVADDGSWFVHREHQPGSALARLRFVSTAQPNARTVQVDAPFTVALRASLVAWSDSCALVRQQAGRLEVVRPAQGVTAVLSLPPELACGKNVIDWSCDAKLSPGCQHAVVYRSSQPGGNLAALWSVALDTGAWQRVPAATADRRGARAPLDGDVRKIVFSPDERFIALNGSGTAALWDQEARSLVASWTATVASVCPTHRRTRRSRRSVRTGNGSTGRARSGPGR